MQDLLHIILRPKGLNTYRVGFETTPTLSLTADPLTMLVQIIIRLLLTTPGSDSFFPTAGAGLQKLLGKMPKTPADKAEIEVQLATGIADVDRQIRSYQSSEKTIPASGRLKSLKLSTQRHSVIIESTGTMIIPLDVKTYAGTVNIDVPFSSSGGSS